VELKVKNMGKRVRFEIAGIIDKQGAEVLKKRFSELDIMIVKELILDFGRVSYISSSGVSRLLMFHKALSTQGGKLRVENDTGIFHELLTITKMDAVFSV
jgi:anti-anti-sigma factor